MTRPVRELIALWRVTAIHLRARARLALKAQRPLDAEIAEREAEWYDGRIQEVERAVLDS